MNAGELVVSLILSAGDFKAQVQSAQKGLDGVQAAAVDAGRDMADAARRGGRGLDNLGSAARSAGKELEDAGNRGALSFDRLRGAASQALAVIGGVSILKSSIAQYYEQAQAIGKTSDALGMGKDWQAWQRAAASAGVDAEELSTRLMDLGDWMQALILHDSGPLKDATKDLGISFTDAKGKAVSLEEGLLRLADATSKIDRQKATSILAQTGFDEKTVPLLLQGRNELEDLLNFQKTQALCGEQHIENAKQQREAQQRLNEAWEAASVLFVRVISPAITFLTSLLGDLLVWVKENRQFVGVFLAALAGIITTLVTPALNALATAAWAALAPFAPFITAAGALALVVGELVARINGGESALSGLWAAFGTGDEIGARFRAVREGVQSILGSVRDALSGGLFDAALALDGKGVIEALKTIWGGISRINDVLVEMLHRVARKLCNLLPDWIRDWPGGDEPSRPDDSMRGAAARPSVLPPEVRAGDAQPGSISNVNNSRQMTSTTSVGEVRIYTQATDAQGIAAGMDDALRNATAQADSAYYMGY